MNTKMRLRVWCSAAIALPLAFSAGCAKEVAHTESDKPGWFGGRTHEETTVYQNPDGTTSTSHEKVKTGP
jgi:ABC-type oligopeptide transport system substrate-binding subunit